MLGQVTRDKTSRQKRMWRRVVGVTEEVKGLTGRRWRKEEDERLKERQGEGKEEGGS